MTTSPSTWPKSGGEDRPFGGAIETRLLRPGVTLVLSKLVGECRSYRYDEPEDMIGIGYHLQGAASFHTDQGAIETTALDCWIGVAPAGSTSTFTLPASGFRTVSVRLLRDAAETLLGDGCDETVIGRALHSSSEDAFMLRDRSLSGSETSTVKAMLDAPFDGSARALFLEGGALSLLAGRVATTSVGVSLSTGDRRRLREARDRLEAEIVDPPSIAQLSRLCGLNEFKLKRDFKRQFGTTVFGYVRERRLVLAHEHLRQGLSVQQAAADVGYACPSRFSAAFRRRFGVAPGVLARAR